MSASTSRRYPTELRDRSVRMVGEVRSDHESEWAAMIRVAELLGVGTPETVRKSCRLGRGVMFARESRHWGCYAARLAWVDVTT